MNLFARYFAGFLLLACLACQKQEEEKREEPEDATAIRTETPAPPKEVPEKEDTTKKMRPRAEPLKNLPAELAQTKQTMFGVGTTIKIGFYSHKYFDMRAHNKDEELLQPAFAQEIVLTPAQMEELFDILYKEKQGGSPSSPCYSPRHIVSFYQQGKRKAHIEICFECGRARDMGLLLPPKTPASDKEVADFVESLGLPLHEKRK